MNDEHIPDYQKLFGELDFRDGDEARSVYSPAAYLVDLLQLIDDEMEQVPGDPDYAKQLEQRRSDIHSILLNSENTFEQLPYLEVVNELLEAKVAPGEDTAEVYAKLKDALYPFNLPFDLQDERVKLYLKYLSIPAEKLHKAFATEVVPELVAREYLGLSDGDQGLLIDAADTAKLKAVYGQVLPDTTPPTPIAAEDERLLPDFGTEHKILVKNFLGATGLKHRELRELLYQNLTSMEAGPVSETDAGLNLNKDFFINNALDGLVRFDADEEYVYWHSLTVATEEVIPVDWFDRVFRFIHLAQLTEISFTDLDLILRSCCDSTLNEQALLRLATIKHIQSGFDLKLDEVCALFSSLDTIGYGEEDEPADLFNRVFNGACAETQKSYVGSLVPLPEQYEEYTPLTFSGDILALANKDYRKRLAHNLGLSEKQLELIIYGFRARVNDDIEDEELHNRLWNESSSEAEILGTLYRTKTLAQALDLGFEELFILLDLLERDPLARKSTQTGALIDFSITERNCYSILRESGVENRIWLVQALAGLKSWYAENNLTAEELLRISTGVFARDFKQAMQMMESKTPTQAEQAKTKKIEVLNSIYKAVKPALLKDSSYVSDGLDQRFSRIIHEVITAKEDTLVAKSDKRLVRFEKKAVEEAAFEALTLVDSITRDDLLDLGVEERIAEKFFKNLVILGYLNTEGELREDQWPEVPEDFTIESDFTDIHKELFDTIAKLNTDFVDVGIFESHLESFDLSETERNELYDNLKFNGIIRDDGTLLSPADFVIGGDSSLLESDSGIYLYDSDIYLRMKEQIGRYESAKIQLNAGLFSDLPLSELEAQELMENLHFNGYTDESGVLLDNMDFLKADAEAPRMAQKFFRYRREILKTIQSQMKRERAKFYSFDQKFFMETAVKLAADWLFDAVEEHYLVDGEFTESDKDFFRDPENADVLDISWPFLPGDNRIVFSRIESILKLADPLMFSHKSLEALGFNHEEKYALISALKHSGILSADKKLEREHVAYFLNVDNAVEFLIPYFEDYSEDVFFMLHDLAKLVDATVQEIVAKHQALHEQLDSVLYESLEAAFALEADSISALSRQIFAGMEHLREEWLLPVLDTVNAHDMIEMAPENSRFNTAYERIKQFALLAVKLKLDKDEIDIVFRDQDLVEKFPEKIELPEITPLVGEKYTATGFDALLESNDGNVYLFISADPLVPGDVARYFAYSSITNERIVTEDDLLSTLLTGDEEKSVSVSRVDAAFMDKLGNDVLIADGKYYFRAPMESGMEPGMDGGWEKPAVWQVREREWGKTHNQLEELTVVDAAFRDESGRSYLFANDKFVRYSNDLTVVDDGYPRNIAEDWKKEGPYKNLPESFSSSMDAAFHGTDNETYFFKGEKFVNSTNPREIKWNTDLWGRIENNLMDASGIDACYADQGRLIVLSGDQVFAYRDSIEHPEMGIQTGYPMELKEHFGPSLPGEFHNGVDAAFMGDDGRLHLFKDEQSVSFASGDPEASILETKDNWGVIGNQLSSGSPVDAVLSGLDGRVYLFSGEQYFRYSEGNYSVVDSGYPRSVSEDWEGLTTVNAAFVLDGKTYLFGQGDVEDENGASSSVKAYVRYSTNDYTEPDLDFPKAQIETDDVWWNLPESVIEEHSFTEVDAVFNAPDGKTFLFAGDAYIYFDQINRWWSEPQKLSERWEGAGFTSIDAAFSGHDGETYLFSGTEYVRFSDGEYRHVDHAYPRPISSFWGNVRNNIEDSGKIDAALVVESREVEENDEGTTDVTKTKHTYVFSGDQFFRYKESDYAVVEPGYPKLLEELKDEPRFENLEQPLEALDAAFADERNVYLFKGYEFLVLSDELDGTYMGADTAAFQGIDIAFMEEGALYAEKGGAWNHLSAPEGKLVTLTPEAPALLTELPTDYKNGLSAVLQGADENTYLFKGETFLDRQLDREYPISEKWGRGRNNIQDRGQVDAAFVGRDGKTYVFSGDQYVVYEGESYVGQDVFKDLKDAPAVRSISADWGGLTNVHLAYVLGDKTYLFEKPDSYGHSRYLCYSTTEYQQSSSNELKACDTNFWNIPEMYRSYGWNSFDSIIVENAKIKNQETLLFIKDREFLQYSVAGDVWSKPESLDKLWTGLRCEHHVFDNLESAFVGANGTAYFFGKECYVSHDNSVFTEEESTMENWGITPDSFKKVDAAFVNRNGLTYLFSGNQYVRYSTDDYCNVDEGYPKFITEELREEEGFENLPAEFETRAAALNVDVDSVLFSAIAANERNLYIFMDDNVYVSSTDVQAVYDIEHLRSQRNLFSEHGMIDAAFVSGDGKTYLFAGDQYIRYSETKYRFVDAGYPKRIALGLGADLGFPIPADFHQGLTAALRDETGKVFLFKDEMYLDVETSQIAAVKDTWGKSGHNFSIQGEPDAVFVDSMGRLYLFKGEHYIRYADTEQDYIEIGYPRSIESTFKELPLSYRQGIDGAFTFGGRTYLFKDKVGESLENYVRYPGDDYCAMAAPELNSIYPVTFEERWGDWSDYRIQDLEIITRYKAIQEKHGGEHTVLDFLRMDQGNVKEPYAMLADIFGRDLEEIQWIKRHNAFLPKAHHDERRFNLEILCRMEEILALSDKMGATLTTLYQDIWKNLYEPLALSSSLRKEKAADGLLELLGSRHCGSDDWDVLVNETDNKLNLLKRDALLAYVVFADSELTDARDLYEKLLSDVEMGECAETSRIKEAIAAVQLYFHRYFLNLEDVTLSDENGREQLKERWKWMRNYRVWEANRKVFLYPENYIRPELRDSKSPEFKALEEELLQGELTEANVTRSFQSYIDKYSEISRLSITGGYVYDSPESSLDKKIVLFGRTRKEPQTYYYRNATFVEGGSDSVNWEPWTEVNVQIDADRVYPVYTQDKVYVFWAKVEERSNISSNTTSQFKMDGNAYKAETDIVNQSVLQVYYSYFNLNGEWATAQKLNYEITSNDTITGSFLDFSGSRQEAADDMDHIKVRCYYTTEREVKPEVDSNGNVEPNKLIAAIKRANDDNSDLVYLKASNEQEDYYLEFQNEEDDKFVYGRRIIPGQTQNLKTKSLIRTWGQNFFLNVEINSEGWHNLVHDTGTHRARVERHNGTGNAFELTLKKGIIGDGYAFSPVNGPGYYLYLNEKKEVYFKKWSEMDTDRERRSATFSLIANRGDHQSDFRFYPDTNLTQEEDDSAGTGNYFETGLQTFRGLFPKEDDAKVALPVFLSVPTGEGAVPWVCFDYKGGSFLCKPSSGATGGVGDNKFFNLPDDFIPISAAFHGEDYTYLFSGDRYVKAKPEEMANPDDPDLTPEPTKDYWGLVKNSIQTENKVDAALIRDGQTFLFCDNQYVRYSSSDYNYVDESYPRTLTIANDIDTGDLLPVWDKVDAAFQVGDKTYFCRDNIYVTSDDLTEEKEIAGDLWPGGLPSTPGAADVKNVFQHGGLTYAFLHDDTLIEVDVPADMSESLNTYYDTSATGGILADVNNVFASEGFVYLKTDSGNFQYDRVDESSQLFDFWQAPLAVHVEKGAYFYTLYNDSETPTIQIWDQETEDWKSITIGNVSDPVDTFFVYEGNLYILAGDSYMRENNGLATLRSLNDGDELSWNTTGTIADLLTGFQGGVAATSIDSAFKKGDKYFLTSGERYIRYSYDEDSKELTLDPDFPKTLSDADADDGLPNWEKIDAAFEGADGILRFFRNDIDSKAGVYALHDSLSDLIPINSFWARVFNRIQEAEEPEINAAFQLKDKVYVISVDQYYIYDMDDGDTLELREGYPRLLRGNVDGLPDKNRIYAAYADGDLLNVFYKEQHSRYEWSWSWPWGKYTKITYDENMYVQLNVRSGERSSGISNANWQWPTGFADFTAVYNDGVNINLVGGTGVGKEHEYYSSPDPISNPSNNLYDIIRLSSVTGARLSQALFSGGVDGLMEPAIQEIDELPVFTFDETRSGDAVIRVNPDRVSGDNFPVNSHLEFRGANGDYYWELFYHIPTLIGQSLNTAQNFEEAKRWYEYIFDPTERGEYWKFLPFLAVDIAALIASLKNLIVDEEPDSELTIAVNALSAKLATYAPAFAGQASMAFDDQKELEKLHVWNKTQKKYDTWPEVSALEELLKTSTGVEQELLISAGEVLEIIKHLPRRYELMVAQGPDQIKTYLDDPFDPHAIAALRRVAYRRAGVMAYIDNLIDWGDQLFRQYTHESINEARMLYVLAYELLGKKPENLGTRVLSDEMSYEALENHGADTGRTAYDFLFDVQDINGVRSFTHAGVVHESVANPYFFVPENKRLMEYWERVEDRLYKIRHCLNIMGVNSPLPLFQPPIDPMALVGAVAGGGGGLGAALAGMQAAVPHYRFSFVLAQARELASKISRYGSDLLTVIEKKDSEELSLLQKRQEGVILKMTHAIKEAQIREAEENLKNLEESKRGVEQEKKHYDALIETGFIPTEEAQMDMMVAAIVFFGLSGVTQLVASYLALLPDAEVGSPTTSGITYGGSKLNSSASAVASAFESTGEAIQQGAEIAGIKAQHERSKEEWVLRQEMAEFEIKQLEFQIEGAKWRINAVQHELSVHEKETEHNESVALFMKEKFSNEKLYQWMSGKLSALYFQTYKLAHDLAKSAEKAYQFERGFPEAEVSFIGGSYWDSLNKGLLSGETLGLDLDRMEQAYQESDSRSLEIIRKISLMELDPMAFHRLKTTGICEFTLGEDFYDYDYPGHYRRQIKTIGVQINAGENEVVYGTLTQLRNKTVMNPDPKAVKFLLKPEGAQPLTIRADWRPNQQIAVSKQHWLTEQSHGLFDLRYEDSRYLPFEGTGAVSAWRLELKGKKGLYNIDEIADAEVEVRYTSLQGGQAFADAVKGMLKPYETAVHLDLVNLFPNEMYDFVSGETDTLKIQMTPDMFPNLFGSKITGVFSHFETEGEGQISMVMNNDSALTLRQDKLLLTNALAVGRKGETWTFKAKGNRSQLVKMDLIVGYKATVE